MVQNHKLDRQHICSCKERSFGNTFFNDPHKIVPPPGSPAAARPAAAPPLASMVPDLGGGHGMDEGSIGVGCSSIFSRLGVVWSIHLKSDSGTHYFDSNH